MALQITKYVGLTVISSVSTSKIDYAKDQGVDFVIDYRKEDLGATVMEYTDLNKATSEQPGKHMNRMPDQDCLKFQGK